MSSLESEPLSFGWLLPSQSLTNACLSMRTPCFEESARVDWSVVVVKPALVSKVPMGKPANFICVPGCMVVVTEVVVCKDRRTVISVNTIPRQTEMSMNIR